MSQKQKMEDFGVKEGDQILLRGNVVYARIDKAIDGESLARDNERRRQNNQMLMEKPYRTITIEDVTIIQGENTPLANFQTQRIYEGKSGRPNISFVSKSKYAPKYAHLQNGEVVQIPDPKKNPDVGQEVYLTITAFSVPNQPNIGSTFDAVMFGEGPIRFYESGGNLTGYGQVLATDLRVQSTAIFPNEPVAPSFAATIQMHSDTFGPESPTGVDPAAQSGFDAKATDHPQQSGFSVNQAQGFSEALQFDPGKPGSFAINQGTAFGTSQTPSSQGLKSEPPAKKPNPSSSFNMNKDITPYG